MAIDARENIGAEIAIAQSLGSGIGSFLGGLQHKKQKIKQQEAQKLIVNIMSNPNVDMAQRQEQVMSIPDYAETKAGQWAQEQFMAYNRQNDAVVGQISPGVQSSMFDAARSGGDFDAIQAQGLNTADAMRSEMTNQDDKQFGVAPWYVSPQYRDDPAAQAEISRRQKLAGGEDEGVDFSNLRYLNKELTDIDKAINDAYDPINGIEEGKREELLKPLIERRNDLMGYYQQEKARIKGLTMPEGDRESVEATPEDKAGVSGDTYPAAPDLQTSVKLKPIWGGMTDEEKEVALDYLRRGGDVNEILKRIK